MEEFKKIESILDELNHKENSKRTNTCKVCNSSLFDSTSEGVIVCTNCGLINDIYFVAAESVQRPIIKEKDIQEQKYNTKSCYKRTTHIVEVLNNLQGKTVIDIPKKEYNKITSLLNKRKQLKNPSYENIYNALINLNLKKYLPYVASIYHNITGRLYLKIKPSHEAKIIHMFKQIQYPYDQSRPKNRKNILRYNYIIYKLCEILNYKKYLPYITIIKGKAKLKQYDAIWKKICKELNWKFYPTI
jgi:transcription initiation factor TFIIIB Brf1 subunit/transcription initiation factor TFIIB